MSVSNQLRIAMNEAEISQTELAKRVGMSKSSISQYVSGKAVPSDEAFKKLADALGCTVDFLHAGERETQPQQVKLRNVSIADAAKRLGKNPQFIRVGLQRGRLPFGTAVNVSGKQWSYHISPKLLDEYIGKEDDE